MVGIIPVTDDIAIVHKEMQAIREHIIKIMDDTLAGRETDEWVPIEVLQNLHKREQALNEQMFEKMPFSEPQEFEPAEVESEEEVVDQLREYIEAVDPNHEGFDLDVAMGRNTG